MKVPGRAWLQFEVSETAGGAIVSQTAIFDPPGSSASSTGTRSGRSTASSSVACCGTSARDGSSGVAHAGRGGRAVTQLARSRDTPAHLAPYRECMEEARSVLERLDRIETMRRANAGPAELLGELRVLLREAEEWVEVEGGDGANGGRAAP